MGKQIRFRLIIFCFVLVIVWSFGCDGCIFIIDLNSVAIQWSCY
jgi:hypothetical protein